MYGLHAYIVIMQLNWMMDGLYMIIHIGVLSCPTTTKLNILWAQKTIVLNTTNGGRRNSYESIYRGQ